MSYRFGNVIAEGTGWWCMGSCSAGPGKVPGGYSKGSGLPWE